MPNPNEPANSCDPRVVLCHVDLRMIDRLYDVGPVDFEDPRAAYSNVDGSAGLFVNVAESKGADPRVAFHKWKTVLEKKANGSPGSAQGASRVEHICFDKYGRDLADAPFESPHAPRCTVERERWDPRIVSRTFIRSRSLLVKRSWVYVFAANSERGDNGRLVAELYFDGAGRFHRSKAETWIREEAHSAEPDPALRSVSAAEPESDLWLDVYVTDPRTKGKQLACYFFYLAPWQLPWDGVESIRQDLRHRAVRLGAPYYTDVFGNRDPATAEPIVPDPGARAEGGMGGALRGPDREEVLKKLLKSGCLAFVLHLPDPFREANLRAFELSEVLERIEAETLPKSQDTKYVLAKQLELFTMKDPRLRSLVEKKLDEYLYPYGVEKMQRMWRVASVLAREAIAWIARPERLTGQEVYWDTLHVLNFPQLQVRSRRRFSTQAPRYHDEPWRNLYGEALSYYRNASEETRRDVLSVDAHVKHQLAGTTEGQTQLNLDLQRLLASNDRLAATLDLTDRKSHDRVDKEKKANALAPPSGLDLVLDFDKSWNKSGARIWKIVNAVYAAAWARQLRGQEVLARIEKLQKAFGIEDLLLPEERQKVEGMHGKELKKVIKTVEKRQGALNEGRTSKVQDDVFHERGEHVRNAGLQTLGFVRTYIEFYEAVHKVVENGRDPRAYFEASGSLASLINDGGETYASWHLAITGKKIEIKGLAKLGVYANVVSLVTDTIDFFESRDGGQQAGRGIRCMSSLLTLASSLTGVGGISVTVVLWAIQGIGKWVEEEFSDLTRFLRECEFGATPSAWVKWTFNRYGNKYLQEPIQGNYGVQRDLLEHFMYDWQVSLAAEYVPLVQPPMITRGIVPPRQHDLVFYLVIKPYYWHCYPASVKWDLVGLKISGAELDMTRTTPSPLREIRQEAYPTAKTSDLVVVDRDKCCFRMKIATLTGSIPEFPIPVVAPMRVEGTLTLSLPGIDVMSGQIFRDINVQQALTLNRGLPSGGGATFPDLIDPFPAMRGVE